MRPHLDILADLLKDAGVSQQQAAEWIGHRSGSAVGMMLRGERGMSRLDLERLCELAGVTIAQLAAQSNDLVLTKHPEAVQAAALVDELPAEARKAMLILIRSYQVKPTDR
jgi:predicted transcriptional regulator